jgi:glycine/D-amino acid oxidase-like deaminating enzyme
LLNIKQSIPVLEEYLKIDPRSTVKLLSKKEMESRHPLFKKNKNFGGLHSTDEVRIEPRLAIPAVAKYLQSLGIDFLWKEEVLDFTHQQIISQKEKLNLKN